MKNKIQILDLHFLGLPHTVGVFLLETSIGAVLFETGPHSTISHLEKELKIYGHNIENIQHVFITHIHLDHAGAAWFFAEKGATIYLHPLGVQHLADPTKLMDSAKRIYQDSMDHLWGKMNTIDVKNLQKMEHGEAIVLGDTKIIGWHTPGHAIHHIAWQVEDKLITGDVAGVKIENGAVVPPCPPPDIHIEDWIHSLEIIQKLPIKELYLTHYGIVTDVFAHTETLKKTLVEYAEWVKMALNKNIDTKTMTADFENYIISLFRKQGLTEQQIKQYQAANPPWMTVIGLTRYWKKISL
ncbi:MAG: MBL fold metallo-hydrolase [Chitinophagaceae bacterium]|nr:MBL fold metallo-hydrolase [Chitinophagaceae bacterium]